ncbi:MAG TPA: ATP-grasp domain-containing protein [Rhizomicrobium sp.]
MSSRVLLCTSVTWPYAARLAAAFAQAGARVEALFPRRHPMRFSRHLSAQYAYSPLSPLDSLRRAIAAAAPDLLIACDDRAASQLRQLHDEAEHPALADLITRSLGDLSVYPRLTARHAFVNEARMIGVTAAPSMAVASEKELEAAFGIFGFPAVLKADESWGGDGVVLAHGAAEARQAFHRFAAAASPLREMARAMKKRDAHFLSARSREAPAISVQKFVDGRPATTSFACWQGEIVGINHFDVIETCGDTGPASVVRQVDCPWMEDAAQKIAAHFGLSGLHGLDFMRDREGVAHLIEINPRATPTSYLALGLDHDLTAGLLTAALGHPAVPRPAATTNDLIALFPQEWTRDPHSAHFASAFHDAPWDDPVLLRASLGEGRAIPTRRRLNDNLAEAGLGFQL